MSYRKILNLTTLISFGILCMGYSFIFPENFGMCAIGDYGCIYPRSQTVGEPILFGLTPLILILILLQFFRKEVFFSWCKYAVPLIPFIIIVIINTPVYCQATLGLCLDKKGMTKFLADGFALLSVIVIIAKSFALRRMSK